MDSELLPASHRLHTGSLKALHCREAWTWLWADPTCSQQAPSPALLQLAMSVPGHARQHTHCHLALVGWPDCCLAVFPGYVCSLLLRLSSCSPWSSTHPWSTTTPMCTQPGATCWAGWWHSPPWSAFLSMPSSSSWEPRDLWSRYWDGGRWVNCCCFPMTAHGKGTREDALSTFLHGEGGFSPVSYSYCWQLVRLGGSLL